MTSHVGRLYVTAIAVFVFFLAWAAVAARPWASRAHAGQVQLLSLREQALKRETALVDQILALRARQPVRSTAPPRAAPPVRVVTLPPLTITRTS